VTPVGAEEAIYVAAVLTLYADLPDTPLRASVTDQALAHKLHSETVPLSLIESAFLLATLRRTVRSSELPPLPKIRSLAYFLPIIAELQQQPLPDGYLAYLRLKLQKLSQDDRHAVQKNTLLDDR
jgi:hypothetical protein